VYDEWSSQPVRVLALAVRVVCLEWLAMWSNAASRG
jgi:hypothetical protein